MIGTNGLIGTDPARLKPALLRGDGPRPRQPISPGETGRGYAMVLILKDVARHGQGTR